MDNTLLRFSTGIWDFDHIPECRESDYRWDPVHFLTLIEEDEEYDPVYNLSHLFRESTC